MSPYMKNSLILCKYTIQHLALSTSRHVPKTPPYPPAESVHVLYGNVAFHGADFTLRAALSRGTSAIFLLLFATVFSAHEGGGWPVLNSTAHLGKQLGSRGKEKRNSSKVKMVPNRNKVTEVSYGVRGPSPGR